MKQIPKQVKAFDGGRAFPESVSADPLGGLNYSTNPGMSLREWLTGCALAGGCGFDTSEGSVGDSQLAVHAVEIADETLKRLREPVEILVDACDHGVVLDPDVDTDDGKAWRCKQCQDAVEGQS